MSREYLFVVTPWEKDVLYHKRMVNFTGGYQAPSGCDRKVSIEQAVVFLQPWKCFRTVLKQFRHHWSWFQNSSWLHQSQDFPKRIPMNILNCWSFTLIAMFSPWNLKWRWEKEKWRHVGERGIKISFPHLFHRKMLLTTLRSLSALLFLLLLQLSSLQSRGAHGQPEPGNAPLLALWDQPTTASCFLVHFYT